MSNNSKLKRLIASNNLTMLSVSKLLDVSLSAVYSWTAHPESVRFRNMPLGNIKYLELLIKAQQKGVIK